MAAETELPAREAMEYDVVIVGAGPAGLAAAIRLKQLDADRSVVVVEKGSAVGAHILSGVVVDPIGLDRLLPDWREDPERPLKTQVAADRFLLLGPSGGVKLPTSFDPEDLWTYEIGVKQELLGERCDVHVKVEELFSGVRQLFDVIVGLIS